MKKIFLLSIILFAALVIQSCSDDSVTNQDPPVNDNLTLIGTQYSNGMKINLYSDTVLFTGYNDLYVEVKDSVSGIYVNDAHVELMPMMNMGSMSHSCPFDNPSSSNEKASVIFPLTVTEPVYSKLKSKTVNGSTYFVSMIEPSKPKVGINDLMLKVNKRVTMMDFPNDSAYTFSVYPWMPSMGHSSPNNVNPVYTTQGMYDGDVNFTMTGDWRITLKFIESPQDSLSFDLVF